MPPEEKKSPDQTVYIFTDGACSGNPGRGGYGVILRYGKNEKELSEGFELTTNNRMELLAVIKGLEALKHPGYNVIITSDSKYVVDALEKGWLHGWEKKEWKKVKNADLWQRFLQQSKKQHVKFKWIKGHAGHFENERCDVLAVEASQHVRLNKDEGYLKMLKEKKGMFD